MNHNVCDRFFACEECWKRGTNRRLSECVEHCPPMPPMMVAAIERDVRQALAESEQPPVDWPAVLGYEPEPNVSILEEPYPEWTWPRWTWRKKLQAASGGAEGGKS